MIMSEKDLGKALLELDAGRLSETSDLHRETERLERYNKRWVRWLTGLTILFSLLAAFGVFMLFWVFHYKLDPIMQRVYVDLEAPETITEYDAVAVGLGWMFRCWWVSLACVAGALVGLVLAGITTVWLILASRRATIRHVNACLIEISEQLTRLQPPTPDASGG
jgi:ABC-type multidrug transport system fused ATPase/permease subunit